jgi:hypothetical protein
MNMTLNSLAFPPWITFFHFTVIQFVILNLTSVLLPAHGFIYKYTNLLLSMSCVSSFLHHRSTVQSYPGVTTYITSYESLPLALPDSRTLFRLALFSRRTLSLAMFTHNDHVQAGKDEGNCYPLIPMKDVSKGQDGQ